VGAERALLRAPECLSGRRRAPRAAPGHKWSIVVLLEFEHGTLRAAVEEVQLMFDYCKRALS
jgi:hypothetical protein